MKKAALLLMLALMAFAALPVMALAANEDEASVTVTYTKDAPPTEEKPPNPPPAATYEINIPATVEIENPFTFTEFTIDADNVNLPDGQTIVVYIDGDSFGNDGDLHIANRNDDVLGVDLRLRKNDFIVGLEPNDVVAEFDHNGTPSNEYRSVVLVPYQDEIEAAPPGTYTGTLYFNIALEG